MWVPQSLLRFECSPVDAFAVRTTIDRNCLYLEWIGELRLPLLYPVADNKLNNGIAILPFLIHPELQHSDVDVMQVAVKVGW